MTEDRNPKPKLSDAEKAERRAKNAANRAKREAKAENRAEAPAAQKPEKQKPV